MPDNQALAEKLLRKSSFLEIVVCNGTATHLQTRPDEAFLNWATYADVLLKGGELADIQLDTLFASGVHWTRCALVTKSDLEADFTKATVLAEFFLACPHTIEVDLDKAVQPRLIIPAGAKV
jgi:hypothetical protein